LYPAYLFFPGGRLSKKLVDLTTKDVTKLVFKGYFIYCGIKFLDATLAAYAMRYARKIGAKLGDVASDKLNDAVYQPGKKNQKEVIDI
jgi:hypothetical protein